MKKIFLIILIALTLSPIYGHAQATTTAPVSRDAYTFLEPIPCIDGIGGCEGGVIKKIELKDYILYIYKFSIALAIFLAIVMIIWGGFLYITSEVPFIKSDGRSKITNAVTGLAMVLVSYLILRTVDPRLVNVDTTIEPLKVDTSDALRFQQQLSLDIRAVNAENQLLLQNTRTEMEAVVARRNSINARCDSGELVGDECGLQRGLIEQERKEIIIKQQMIVAEDEGVSALSKVQGLITPDLTDDQLQSLGLGSVEDAQNSPLGALEEFVANTVDNNPSGTRQPTDTANVIQRNYNMRINAILDTNLNNTFDKVQTLEKQRDFFISQVDEHIALTKEVRGAILENDFYYGLIDGDEAYFEKKIAEYRANMANPQKAIDAGLSQAHYNVIFQNRINMMKAIPGFDLE